MYTAFLEAPFEAHQILAQQFTRGEDSPLTSEQLETLREDLVRRVPLAQ